MQYSFVMVENVSPNSLEGFAVLLDALVATLPEQSINLNDPKLLVEVGGAT